jgi:hypothetical protein
MLLVTAVDRQVSLHCEIVTDFYQMIVKGETYPLPCMHNARSEAGEHNLGFSGSCSRLPADQTVSRELSKALSPEA